MNQMLRTLRDQHWFKEHLVALAKEAPQVRPYDPEDPQSVERWKSDSWQRRGYFLALQQFGFTLEEITGDK